MPPLRTGAEGATAVTDLFNTALAVILLLLLFTVRDDDPFRRRCWRLLFLLLALSSGLGALIHGFCWPAATVQRMWLPLILLMYGAAACFLLAPLSDPALIRWQRPALRASLLLFALLMLIFHRLADMSFWRLKLFFVFALFCLGGGMIAYLALLRRGKRAVWYLLAAIGVAVAAGVIQVTRSCSFTLIWRFDYNSVAHFLLAAALTLFFIAYRKLALSDRL